jgi:two-component system, OmpR family, sensor kinase
VTIFGRTLALMGMAVFIADGAAYLLLSATQPGMGSMSPPMRPAGDSPPPPPPGDPGQPPSNSTAGPPPGGPGPPQPPGMRTNQHFLWTWIALLEAVALIPMAWLFAGGLAAPLKRFANASNRVGLDANVPPLAREGPTELVAAVDAFNSMQGRLKRLIDERTHMVGAIAHDLRTPLMRLAFRLDDLDPPLGDKVRADIDEMRIMISAALDFIRERSSNMQHERLDLRLLVERVVEEQSDLGHEVVLKAGLPVTIEGNPLALRRAVANVVENAIRYGERARVDLLASGADCRLEIDDDGPGIPESLQAQVFEPFFRIEGSRNRNTGGIGLGLAAVRAIVREHSGEILIGNRKEGGLKVVINLPVIQPDL